jgi:hypothetical protein
VLGWNSLESVQRIHAGLELLGIILFGVLVLVELFEHVERDLAKQEKWKTRGLWVFALAVLAELVAYPYGRRSDRLSNEQLHSDEQVIASLNGKVAGAKRNAEAAADAAKRAEDSAAQANLAVYALSIEAKALGARVGGLSIDVTALDPRARLIAEASSDLIRKLSPFAGQKVVLYSWGPREKADQETLDTLVELVEILGRAGARWDLERGGSISSVTFFDRPRLAFGIFVFVSAKATETTRHAAHALSTALTGILPPSPNKILYLVDPNDALVEPGRLLDLPQFYVTLHRDAIAVQISWRPK